jgi:hypothetical protein
MYLLSHFLTVAAKEEVTFSVYGWVFYSCTITSMVHEWNTLSSDRRPIFGAWCEPAPLCLSSPCAPGLLDPLLHMDPATLDGHEYLFSICHWGQCSRWAENTALRFPIKEAERQPQRWKPLPSLIYYALDGALLLRLVLHLLHGEYTWTMRTRWMESCFLPTLSCPEHPKEPNSTIFSL